jgi:hypothetical protein
MNLVETAERWEVFMKRYQKSFWVIVLSVVMSIFACVTINIYFPAEKVESVAGEIVGEIRGSEAGEPGSAENKESSSLRRSLTVFTCSLAWAEEATSVSNATIRGLKEKMKSRYAQMKPFYQKGMLTEKDDGFLSLESTEGLGLKEKRDLKSLVDAENKDRALLYEEVARALEIQPSQVHRVAEIFAKEWQKQ